ncbi:MAG: double zinc ribbon domain-containing protein [Blastocatellia bacterium]
MQKICDYCKGTTEGAILKCQNCGAPMVRAEPDFRICPHCRRKLLALASPACNYCGRRLPDEYIVARRAQLQRISEVEATGEHPDLTENVDEMFRQTARSKRKRSSFFATITDWTDLFS